MSNKSDEWKKHFKWVRGASQAALLYSVLDGNFDDLRRIVSIGATIKGSPSDSIPLPIAGGGLPPDMLTQMPPLAAAAAQGLPAMIHFLLGAGALDPPFPAAGTTACGLVYTALAWALHMKRNAAVTALITVVPKDCLVDCLHEAMRNKSLPIFRTLVNSGIRPVLNDTKFMPSWYFEHNHGEWSKILLKAAKADARWIFPCTGSVHEVTDGYSNLMAVASKGQHNEVRILISAGVDVNVEDEYKHTALSLAAANTGSEMCVRLLLAAGASRTDLALFNAIDHRHARITRFLVEGGCNIEAKDPKYFNRTPLIAASEHQVACVTPLLDAGACVNTTDSQGVTPLMAACSVCVFDTMSALLEAGADTNARALDGTGALRGPFVKRRNVQAMRMLLHAGARVEEAFPDWGTALSSVAREYITDPCAVEDWDAAGDALLMMWAAGADMTASTRDIQWILIKECETRWSFLVTEMRDMAWQRRKYGLAHRDSYWSS
jgi:ankyrin repeat protein